MDHAQINPVPRTRRRFARPLLPSPARRAERPSLRRASLWTALQLACARPPVPPPHLRPRHPRVERRGRLHDVAADPCRTGPERGSGALPIQRIIRNGDSHLMVADLQSEPQTLPALVDLQSRTYRGYSPSGCRCRPETTSPSPCAAARPSTDLPAHLDGFRATFGLAFAAIRTSQAVRVSMAYIGREGGPRARGRDPAGSAAPRGGHRLLRHPGLHRPVRTRRSGTAASSTTSSPWSVRPLRAAAGRSPVHR